MDLSLAKAGQNQSWQQWENLEGGITFRTMPCWICLRKHGKHIKFPNFPKNVSQCVSATKSSSNWVRVQFILLCFPMSFSSSVSSVSSVEAKSEAQGILTNDVSLARFITEIAFVYTNRAEWCAISRGFVWFRGVNLTLWPPVASGLQVASRYLASFTSALGSWSVPQQNNFTEQISATKWHAVDFCLQVWVQSEILPESWQVWCILYADYKLFSWFFRICLPLYITLTQLAPDLDYLNASSQKRQEVKKRTYWKVGQWGLAQCPGISSFRKLVRWVL